MEPAKKRETMQEMERRWRRERCQEVRLDQILDEWVDVYERWTRKKMTDRKFYTDMERISQSMTRFCQITIKRMDNGMYP